jgi:hypothetical protein
VLEILPFSSSGSLKYMLKLIFPQKYGLIRSNPVEIEENPINDKDKSDFLRYITIKNPNTELWYWEQFFE